MSITTSNYSRIFNRLCHMVILSKENRTEQCIDNITLLLFAIDSEFAPSSISEFIDAFDAYFGLIINQSSIQKSVDRHISQKKLYRDKPLGIYRIDPDIKSQLENNILKATDLENKVHDQWLESIEKILPENPKDIGEQLWKCLRLYIGKVFQRHGIETIRLLSGENITDGIQFRSLSSCLDESIKECCLELETEKITGYIRDFFQNTTLERTKYLAQLLDGTFTFYALANDKLISDYLNQEISPISLFLDTNFIFGLLDLHINPLMDVSKEVVEVIQRYKLPFKFYYHEETLKEIRHTINSSGDRLKKQKWQQSISRAVVHNGQLTGIERRYHEMNSEVPLDPDVFLSKYEGITELLAERGFNIYRNPAKENETDERNNLIARYDAFMKDRRPDRPKPYEALNHDIVIWQTANRLRRKGISLLDAGSLILSVDYYFYYFDWENLRKDDSIGTVVLPNHLLQILRPFTILTNDFDKHFVETFAIPEFRVVASDYLETQSKVISVLNTYSDISERTASRILTNSMLTDQLRGVDENDPEFRDAIDSVLARDNETLLEEKEMLLAEKELTKKDIIEKNALLKQVNEDLEQKKKESNLLNELVRKAEIESSKKDEAFQSHDKDTRSKLFQSQLELEKERGKRQENETEKKHYMKLNFWTRIAFGLFMAIVGVALIIWLPSLLSWSWLEKHTERLGIYACFISIWLALSYTVGDSNWKRGRYAFFGVIPGCAYVLFQILHS